MYLGILAYLDLESMSENMAERKMPRSNVSLSPLQQMISSSTGALVTSLFGKNLDFHSNDLSSFCKEDEEQDKILVRVSKPKHQGNLNTLKINKTKQKQ